MAPYGVICAMDLKSFMAGLGADQRSELARACDTTPGHLQNVMYGYRTCAADLAVKLERETRKAVTRQELRPNDWHEIWPELIAADGAPAIQEPEAKAA